MALPLCAYPLGGVGEFGKNMMVYAMGKDAVIVDCGMGFPEPGQHGVDVVVPDISALQTLGLKIHALLLTHGHEDHIGGIPYILPQLNIPVYGSPMTLGLVEGKLAEDKTFKADLRPLPEDGQRIQTGPFEVEAIPVTHSIMDAVSIAIHTPYGAIVHTGDFKFDLAPIDGRSTEMHRFSALGDAGVVLLASDSTNATRSGSGPAEGSVGPILKQAVAQCEGKVVVTTFASNMFRIQQIIDAAVSAGRRVVLAGRSLERNTDIAQRLDRLLIPAGTMVNIKQISDVPAEKLLIIATGSQGEAQAALARIAQGRHPSIKLEAGDLVIFSSSSIPGNERTIAGLFNHIYRRHARVLHAGQAHLHVSGHAQAHELKTMLHLTRPRYFYPVHGEYRYLVEHKLLGRAVGIPEENIVIAENGQSVELDETGIRLGDVFSAGSVFVDGMHRDEIDDLVLRDRRVLAEEGIMTVTVVVNQHDGTLLGVPEMLARGVLHQENEIKLLEAAESLLEHLESSGQEFLSDVDAAKEEIRIWTRRWCKKNLGRHPMVVPVVIEV